MFQVKISTGGGGLATLGLIGAAIGVGISSGGALIAIPLVFMFILLFVWCFFLVCLFVYCLFVCLLDVYLFVCLLHANWLPFICPIFNDIKMLLMLFIISNISFIDINFRWQYYQWWLLAWWWPATGESHQKRQSKHPANWVKKERSKSTSSLLKKKKSQSKHQANWVKKWVKVTSSWFNHICTTLTAM